MSMKTSEMLAQFQRNTKDHSMEVLRDDGLYRHLKFSNNGSSIYRFDLITWPGYLAVAGDMGEYIFSRVPDMFQFFRGEPGGINTGYWAEKCLAVDRHNGIEGFDEDVARQRVKEALESHYEDEPEKLKEGLAKADEDINYSEGEVRFYDSCMNYETPEGRCPFDGGEMPDCKEYSLAFVWVLYAIVWGINQYDLLPTPAAGRGK